MKTIIYILLIVGSIGIAVGLYFLLSHVKKSTGGGKKCTDYCKDTCYKNECIRPGWTCSKTGTKPWLGCVDDSTWPAGCSSKKDQKLVRYSQCQDQHGNVVPDSLCPTPAPVVEKSDGCGYYINECNVGECFPCNDYQKCGTGNHIGCYSSPTACKNDCCNAFPCEGC